MDGPPKRLGMDTTISQKGLKTRLSKRIKSLPIIKPNFSLITLSFIKRNFSPIREVEKKLGNNRVREVMRIQDKFSQGTTLISSEDTESSH